MMIKEFVPYEQALALKELGFDEPCFGYFNTNNHELFLDNSNNRTSNDDDRWCSAPLYQQAFRWFRENYDITQRITRDGSLAKEGIWAYTIIADLIYFNDGYNTYKEAEIACLIRLIEVIRMRYFNTNKI